jgi:sec-independent protein translocase protein TatC
MSGAVDDDVARTVADGRETLGAMLSAAQTHLQKVFIVFLVVFLGAIYVLRSFVWSILKADLLARAEDVTIIATTPFDVILLQVKIGLVLGALAAVPPLLYYSRDALKRRGRWPSVSAPWKVVIIALLSVLLFSAGVSYGYFVFFPLMFDFLSSNAVEVGFEPTYSIVLWVEFVFVLTLSFGLAAQLPLAMAGLSLSRVVPYELFRDKWKYAVIAALAFGALFSPPDPFTQILWAAPIIALYGLSLGVTNFLVTLQRGSADIDLRGVLAERWPRIVAIATVAGALVAGATLAGVGAYLYTAAIAPLGLGRVPYVEEVLGVSRPAAIALVGLVLFAVVAAAAFAYYVYASVTDTAARQAAVTTGDPAAIDLDGLDAAGVRAAPEEAFAAMDEEEALARASAAIDANEPAKGQAILDRFDAAAAAAAAAAAGAGSGTGEGNETGEEWPAEWESAGATGAGDTAGTADATAAGGTEAAGTDTEGASVGPGEPLSENEADPDSGVATRTTAGMVNAFTAEETTEEDIGGYYYDLAFVLSTLRSRSFRLVALFMTVLAGTFIALYRGGIGVVRRDFLANLPAAVTGEVDVVTLHPVEALVFEIKFSTIVAAVVTFPFVLYYAWPALKERGLAGGDRNVLLAWAGALALGLAGGVAFGYTTVAPTAISWLAADVIDANMVIAYRISSAGWLVFLTTAGVGLVATIPVTMVLFHRGGIVLYRTMRKYWREVSVGVFAVAALASPRGVFMMFILGVPTMLAYGFGLGILWLYTLGGRRVPGPSEERSAD